MTDDKGTTAADQPTGEQAALLKQAFSDAMTRPDVTEALQMSPASYNLLEQVIHKSIDSVSDRLHGIVFEPSRFDVPAEVEEIFVEAYTKEITARLDRAASTLRFINGHLDQIERLRHSFINEATETESELRDTLISLAPYIAAVIAEKSQGDPTTVSVKAIAEEIKICLDIFSEKDNLTSFLNDVFDRQAECFLYAELTTAAERIRSTITPEVLQGLTPEKHIMANNTLMNVLQSGDKHDDGRAPTPIINVGGFDLTVARERGKRRELTAFTMVSCENELEEMQFTGGKITEYERQVSDAVLSLIVESERQSLPPIFTTDMIFRAMPGGSDKASAQQKGAITRVMNKFRTLDVAINATDELRRRGAIKPEEEFKFRETYFSATEAEYKIKNGGIQVTAYAFNIEPIILRYARLTNQLITIDARYLEIRKVKQGTVSKEIVTMTNGRQAMIGYMLRRIGIMKHDRKSKHPTQSNTILFDTLFKETGQQSDDREIARRNRNFCFDALDYWTAAGFIKGYEKQTKGRSTTGVTISL